jgi:hypothetical protein
MFCSTAVAKGQGLAANASASGLLAQNARSASNKNASEFLRWHFPY